MDTKSGTERVKETAGAVRENMEEVGDEIQGRMSEYWQVGREKAGEYLQATDRTIRENPYQAVGIALGVGLLIGILISRGRGSDED